MAASSEKELPTSGLFNYDEEKDKIITDSIGTINFKDLFLQNLTPEFIKLFKENINLYYSPSFVEGLSYEYGLFNNTKDMKMALNIYKEAADFEYDYLCMYRMHRIYLNDYDKFDIKKNGDLHRLYLYKCFAYLPNLIIHRHYYLLSKIDLVNELDMFLDKFENNKYDIFDKFMLFLKNNKSEFNLTLNDIELMTFVFKNYFSSNLITEDITVLDPMLKLNKEDGENAYFEAQLKYCNFCLEYNEENTDKEKVKTIFDNLIKEGYYKAACDYGRLLKSENKNEEAKNVLKIGSDNSQQFCFLEYTYLLLSTTDFNQICSNYNLTSTLLKRMCLIICFDKVNHGSFYYMIHYLIKHSSLQDDYTKYVKEIFKQEESYFKIENNELIHNLFIENYVIQHSSLYGNILFYNIGDIIKADKNKALICFKNSYKIAKDKGYLYLKRMNYLFIYKCRKYLYKSNKIPLRKLNKTKEKLLRFYEECDINVLDVFEIYNYYKLYTQFVNENTNDKLISILKSRINDNVYHFKDYVYREKCRSALDKENSENNSLNENKIIFNNDNENDINLNFKTTDEKIYNIKVPKNVKFILALAKLYNKYTELHPIKLLKYKCNGNKLYLFDTIEENGLQEGNVILIIN